MLKLLKRYLIHIRSFSQRVEKNIQYNSRGLSDYKCKFCKGTGKILCLNCDIYYVKENWTEKKCTKCINGMVICGFCRGNGKSHQIF